MDSEWLNFEQAGQLIDGPDGWRSNPDGLREQAQTLLMLAHKGIVSTTARLWTCAAKSSDVGTNRSADATERAEFLLMLCARERSKLDSWNVEITPTLSIHAAFHIADERAGNFDAVRVMRDPGHGKAQTFTVVGLQFSRADVEAAFPRPTSSSAPPRRKSGRPKGKGGFAKADEPLIRQMADMIAANPGMVPYNAAQHFVDQAAGSGGDEAKRRRLADRFSRTRGN